MSEKRFTTDGIDIIDNRQLIEYVVLEKQGRELVVDLLNEQEERIKKLEEENKLKGDFRNFINEDIVRIKKENEQLKEQDKRIKELEEENQRLIKMLDNVANYMQKQHKDMPIDDFVGWWNDYLYKKD